MNIDKHSLIKECYELSLAIEYCGASEELTKASTKAGELMINIDKLISKLKDIKFEDTNCGTYNYIQKLLD